MFTPASLSPVSGFSIEKTPKIINQLQPELRQVYSAAISTTDVDELMSYASVVPLSKIDPNFEKLSVDFLAFPFFSAVVRNFGAEKCRLFCSDIKKVVLQLFQNILWKLYYCTDTPS